MAENVLQTLQHLVQDVIAPDVRETKVRLDSHAKETDTRFIGLEKRIDSLSKEKDAQYKAILAAISEAQARTELTIMSELYPLRERVAVLEAQRR